MVPRSLVIIIVCLLFAILARTTKAVEANVDGTDIKNSRHLRNALGWFGVNLFNLGFHLTQRNRIPKTMKIRARDIKSSDNLQNSAIGYLLQFGYFEMVTEKTETELIEGDYFIDQNDVSKALRELQKFHGLTVTGKPTVETQGLMMRSRCGVKDVRYDSLNRADRYTLSEVRRDQSVLKYWFNPEKYTTDLTKDLAKSEVERSMSLWSDAARVSFVEVGSEEEADVRISFEVGDHGDHRPFYGPWGAHSHVIYPKSNGLVHFDDDEKFTAQTTHGTNLHAVATHEIGHLLGIQHFAANHRNSIMYPIYKRNKGNIELTQSDKAAAVAVMGAGIGTVEPLIEDVIQSVEPSTHPVDPTTPIPEIPPDCIEKIDAALHWSSTPEYVYIFAGSWYYRLVHNNPASGNLLPVLDTTFSPKRIGIDGFFGLPRHIDAAVESIENPDQFYAFKGSKYFLYDMSSRGIVKEGFLTDFWPTETPEKIDGALKTDTQTLGFLVDDKLYEYQSNTQEWRVGCDGSNYFRKFDGLDSLTAGFFRGWTWIFQGAWYSVARNRNGWESYNYMLRSIKADIKLPMCTRQTGALSKKKRRRCTTELRTMGTLLGSFEPSPDCRDFIVDRYNVEVEFDRSDFD